MFRSGLAFTAIVFACSVSMAQQNNGVPAVLLAAGIEDPNMPALVLTNGTEAAGEAQAGVTTRPAMLKKMNAGALVEILNRFQGRQLAGEESQ